MALTQEQILDKVEVLPNDFHFIQIREKTVVKDGSDIIAEKFHRRTLVPGFKNSEGNYEITDTSSEDHLTITTLVDLWTAQTHSDYADHLGATYI